MGVQVGAGPGNGRWLMPPLDLGCHRPDIADAPDGAAQERQAVFDVGVVAGCRWAFRSALTG